MNKLAKKLRLAHKNMIDRCYNENNASFKHYGGRGIAVCDDWTDKEDGRFKFIYWAFHNGFKINLTLDRIDTNGNYSPENCKWSTLSEQLNNQRRNHRILFNGKTQTLTQWANELGIKPNTLQRRIATYKMDINKAFTPVIRQWKHGTRQGYEVHKCKCDACREANNKRHREVRAMRKNKRLIGEVQ